VQDRLTIARPYAEAAFEYAKESGVSEDWAKFLARLVEAVQHPDLGVLIGHPKVSDAVILSIIVDMFGNKLEKQAINFIDLLIGAGRLQLIEQVSELFNNRCAEMAGLANIEVTSAFDLTSEESSQIKQAIGDRLGKNCQITGKTDPSLIGGAVIKIGDSVVDLSIRGRLASLESELG
jgi:F-type H+-transporting ATPase subunit delta